MAPFRPSAATRTGQLLRNNHHQRLSGELILHGITAGIGAYPPITHYSIASHIPNQRNIVPWYYGPEMHLLCKVCKLSNHTYLQKKSLLHMCAFILRQLGWNYEWIITVHGICNSLEDAHILLLLISNLPSIYPSIYLYVNLHKYIYIYCVSLIKSKRIKCLYCSRARHLRAHAEMMGIFWPKTKGYQSWVAGLVVWRTTSWLVWARKRWMMKHQFHGCNPLRWFERDNLEWSHS